MSASSQKGKKGHLTRFCRIFQWVEQQDEDFAAAIRDLCMEGALGAGRRSNGVTLLFPGKAVRADVVAKAYSDEADEAIDILNAHIIPALVRTPAEFKAAAHGSRLGLKIYVDSVDGGKVTVRGGAKTKKTATLVAAAGFHPLGKDNLAVYEIKEGALDFDKGSAEDAFVMATHKLGPGAWPRVHGSAEPPGAEPPGAAAARAAFAHAVEAEYDSCMQADRCASAPDPYLRSVASLLNFLKVAHPAEFRAVCPFVDRDPFVSFYLLLEPYKTAGGDFLLDGSLLFGPGGWNGTDIGGSAVEDFKSCFDAAPNLGGLAAARRATDALRTSTLLGEGGSRANKLVTPPAVVEAYRRLARDNAIHTLSPVYEPASHKLIAGGLKKMWQDMVRFDVSPRIAEIRDGIYDRYAFKDLVHTMQVSFPGNDYEAESTLTNLKTFASCVAPRFEFLALLKFINSTAFMYMAVPESMVVADGWVGENGQQIPFTAELDTPDNMNIYNMDMAKAGYLSLEQAKRSAPGALSAGAVAAVQHYINQNGVLPPGLTVPLSAPPAAPAEY